MERKLNNMFSNDLIKQIEFISELEKLKLIYRQNSVLGQERQENSAEHSWHIALMAIILKDSIKFNDVDIFKVVKMLLIHDIIEIDAGDNFYLDDSEKEQILKKEIKGAKRIFGLLPQKQSNEFTELWHEFEEVETNEAKFAKAMDALQPVINHYLTGKENTNLHDLTKEMIIARKKFIKDTSEDLWEIAEDFIEKSVEKGLYK